MVDAKINDLIFKELIKRGYALSGNTRVWNIADSKLWYLTPKQAQAYLDLENSKDYVKTVNEEIGRKLMTSNANLILKNINAKAINVVDLGCGDGKKAAELIKKLNGKLRVRYCPIDISGYMVQKAIETFSGLEIEELIEFQYNISDFENLENITPLLIKGDFKRNLFLLLGNTLGNFEINELLYEIRSAMHEGDLLLIDTAVADKKVEERAKSHAKNKMVDNFLKYIPLQIGLKDTEIKYGAEFKNSRIEFYYEIKKNAEIKFQDKEVYFKEGDRIIVAIAYKHDVDNLKSIFKLYFDQIQTVLSEDKSQIFVLCKK